MFIKAQCYAIFMRTTFQLCLNLKHFSLQYKSAFCWPFAFTFFGGFCVHMRVKRRLRWCSQKPTEKKFSVNICGYPAVWLWIPDCNTNILLLVAQSGTSTFFLYHTYPFHSLSSIFPCLVENNRHFFGTVSSCIFRRTQYMQTHSSTYSLRLSHLDSELFPRRGLYSNERPSSLLFPFRFSPTDFIFLGTYY